LTRAVRGYRGRPGDPIGREDHGATQTTSQEAARAVAAALADAAVVAVRVVEELRLRRTDASDHSKQFDAPPLRAGETVTTLRDISSRAPEELLAGGRCVPFLIVVGLDLGIARRAAIVALVLPLVPPLRATRAGVVFVEHCDLL